ncbi:DUF2062 domain-containing protein [Novosphingobium sp. PASSN1]|uniref:DUF2062 domain-containing protein n=1 Tax=Novosphingobium sp. PASSN1 TaxID=2015561 RepID=UPI000BD47BF3|nr:DUF2062 domain-containing protein [Novosphingobium sp. PASSN1]OYU35881.1 MAG: hypothetical protein CFE35_06220 [Novosphingobium sp. PASSN1]
MAERMQAVARRMVPTREALVQNRFVRPLAARPELWRYTRRSVPRGVAVGLFVGIFALIPGVQIVGAALMCVPFRANVPLAAGATFLSNPVTTPMILLAALWVGSFLGLDADLTTFQALIDKGAGFGDWAAWLLSSAAPALVLGLFVISFVSAVIGYFSAIVLWRFWTARRRRVRLGRSAADGAPREA